MRHPLHLLLLILVLAGGGGCGGQDSCPSLSGAWTITDHCETSAKGQTVNVTQSGCAITYAAPFTGWTGTVSSSGGVTSTGPTSPGTTLTCTGSAASGVLSMSCTPGGCVVKLQQK